MFSFNMFKPPVIEIVETRFSSCDLLRPLFEDINDLRMQVAKLKPESENWQERNTRVTDLKYGELQPLLMEIDKAIENFNIVPEYAQNEVQDVKLFLDALSSAIKNVRNDILAIPRGMTNKEVKVSGASTVLPLVAYGLGVVSGPLALVAGVGIWAVGSRVTGNNESKTHSEDIISGLQESVTTLLEKVNNQLDSAIIEQSNNSYGR